MDPILGIATGVFAYMLYEGDPSNSADRPAGRSLRELVERRLKGIPPPDDLYAGPAPATARASVLASKAGAGQAEAQGTTLAGSPAARESERILADAIQTTQKSR